MSQQTVDHGFVTNEHHHYQKEGLDDAKIFSNFDASDNQLDVCG